jgi:hypothetical protein
MNNEVAVPISRTDQDAVNRVEAVASDQYPSIFEGSDRIVASIANTAALLSLLP